MRMFFRRLLPLLGVAACTAGMGCTHFQPGPRPLYPGPVEPPEKTALLSGYVAKVDDVDVSQMGGAFSLLPGCHVVTSSTNLGNDSPSGAWSSVVPKLVFALRMQAGHAYQIEAQRQGSGSETSNLKMHAIERDAAGKKLGETPPTYDKADLEGCRAWAAEQGAHETGAAAP